MDWIRWKFFTCGGGEGLLCSSTCFTAVRDLSHLRKENKRLTKWKIDIFFHSLVVKGQCPVILCELCPCSRSSHVTQILESLSKWDQPKFYIHLFKATIKLALPAVQGQYHAAPSQACAPTSPCCLTTSPEDQPSTIRQPLIFSISLLLDEKFDPLSEES